MKPLHIRIEIGARHVAVTARGADGETLVLPSIGPGVVEASAQLCALLEPPWGDERALRSSIRDLSRVLLQPLAAAIHAAREIVVSIPKGALAIPLDLLTHGRQPLFLARPVSYRIGRTSERPEPALVGPSAYTLSDITSDPDRGCLSVARGFGRVTFQDEQDSSPELVRQLQARDVVVFSLHGEVGPDAGDCMFTTAGPIRPGRPVESAATPDLPGLVPAGCQPRFPGRTYAASARITTWRRSSRMKPGIRQRRRCSCSSSISYRARRPSRPCS